MASIPAQHPAELSAGRVGKSKSPKIKDRVGKSKMPKIKALGVFVCSVKGTQVLKDGEHTGATPGRVVRGPGWKK